jgi:nucleoside-diphosphate-sugar epimerase
MRSILHPGMILGPDVRGGALHNLFTVLRGGCWFYPLGFCGLVDVRDVSRAAITLMESDIQGERFLLVAENSSFRGLFREISRRFRRKPPCIPLVPALKTLLLRVRKGFFPGPCMMSRPFDGRSH